MDWQRPCFFFIGILSFIWIVLLKTEKSVLAYSLFSLNELPSRLHQNIGTRHNTSWPCHENDHEKDDDIYYEKMRSMNLYRSMEHQKKFLTKRDQVASVFEIGDRFHPKVQRYAAIPISPNFAFLHVWKCGGTTVENVTGTVQLKLEDNEIQVRQWLALVRDPIDRFLSAWAECGARLYRGEITFGGFENASVLNDLEDDDYDFRIQSWLHEIKAFLPPARSCHTHAFPQANFMLNGNGTIDEHIAIVGDLSEIAANLEIAGVSLGMGDIVGRDANEDEVKQMYFPAHRDQLSKETILALCDFYAMDYFLFDFEPPESCTRKGGPLARLALRRGRRYGQ